MKSKAEKRAEAAERAKHVEHDRTKAHRLGRCDDSCGQSAIKAKQERAKRRYPKREGKTDRKRGAKTRRKEIG